MYQWINSNLIYLQQPLAHKLRLLVSEKKNRFSFDTDQHRNI